MWVFNLWLYLMFVFNQPVYDAMKAAGASCYVFVPALGPGEQGAAPPCFYEVKGE